MGSRLLEELPVERKGVRPDYLILWTIIPLAPEYFVELEQWLKGEDELSASVREKFRYCITAL